MNAEQIRALYQSEHSQHGQVWLLAEIAAQLAELNDTINNTGSITVDVRNDRGYAFQIQEVK